MKLMTLGYPTARLWAEGKQASAATALTGTAVVVPALTAAPAASETLQSAAVEEELAGLSAAR